MNSTTVARDTIVDRVLALAPEASAERQYILVELATIDESTEPSVAAGIFEAAGNASTLWTSDTFWDEDIDGTLEAYLNDDTLFGQ